MLQSHASETVAMTQMKSHTARCAPTRAGGDDASSSPRPASANGMAASAAPIARTTTIAPGRSGRWMMMLFSRPA